MQSVPERGGRGRKKGGKVASRPGKEREEKGVTGIERRMVGGGGGDGIFSELNIRM